MVLIIKLYAETTRSQTYSFTLDFNLRRKVLSTCFTNEKKGLKKSDNFEKSSKMFNDTELVSTTTRIQSLGPEPSQLTREERMQSSSFCIGFFSPLPLNQFPSLQIHSSLFCTLREDPWKLNLLDSLSHCLLVGFGQRRDWEETEGQEGTGIRLCFLYSLPASLSCLWQWLCSSLVTAPIRQAFLYRFQFSLGSSKYYFFP